MGAGWGGGVEVQKNYPCKGKSRKKNHARRIGHFTVVYGSETEGDLVLIQTFLLYYVNQVILMLTIIFFDWLIPLPHYLGLTL